MRLRSSTDNHLVFAIVIMRDSEGQWSKGTTVVCPTDCHGVLAHRHHSVLVLPESYQSESIGVELVELFLRCHTEPNNLQSDTAHCRKIDLQPTCLYCTTVVTEQSTKITLYCYLNIGLPFDHSGTTQDSVLVLIRLAPKSPNRIA